jgi:hypothetical protein
MIQTEGAMSSSDGDGIVTTQPIHDLYLSLLLTMIESGDAVTSMSIMLSTTSGVVTGDLVSREAWKALWTETILTKANASAGSMGLFPDTVDRLIEEVRSEDGASGDSDDSNPHFVHLKDAVVFVGKDRINLRFWRGRLDSVVGWSLGKVDV